MRALLIALALFATPVYAQEGADPGEDDLDILVPLPRMDAAIEAYAAHTGRQLRHGTMRMVTPLACGFVEVPIPPTLQHPYAGYTLRYLTGDCVRNVRLYVINPANSRLSFPSEDEAIELLREAERAPQ